MSIFNFFSENNNSSDTITVLPPDVFKSKISSSSVQLVDIRTPQEFNMGHIDKAKNINFFSRKFKLEFEQMDRMKPLYLYCRSGSRSRQAAHVLVRMGFEVIYDLEGGLLRWDHN